MGERNISLQELGIKDLEHVVIKAKSDQDHGGLKFAAGEPILYFDNIQVAQLTEYIRGVSARGGWRNMSRVVWEDRDDVRFVFSKGTINPLSFNLLLEANMIIKSEAVYIPFMETAEVKGPIKAKLAPEFLEQSYGYVDLSHELSANKKYFVKLISYSNLQSKIDNNNIHIRNDDGETQLLLPVELIDEIVAIDYYYKPENDTVTYTLSQERVANLYTLEATFYMKDENTGDLRTGILEMPKVYIMSNIDLRMGERADPAVGSFEAVAMPECDDQGECTLCRITYVDGDIYGL